MGMARLQDLIQILTGMHTLDFARMVVDRFSEELCRDSAINPGRHQQVAFCLAACAQSLAMFEEYETALRIGSDLESSLASDRHQHASCCGQALQRLLSPATTERLIEVFLQKRVNVKVARMAASLLQLVQDQAAEIVFHLLEEERAASGRSRLLHIARQLGEGAFQAAIKRLEDER